MLGRPRKGNARLMKARAITGWLLFAADALFVLLLFVSRDTASRRAVP